MKNEDSSYNGWKNRHTHDAYLWLSNTESSYRGIRDAALTEDSTDASNNFRFFGQYHLNLLGNPDGIDYTKVDWEEIHEAFSE